MALPAYSWHWKRRKAETLLAISLVTPPLEDLLARIDLWHFHMPGLAERREDIEPNLAYELDAFARAHWREPEKKRGKRRYAATGDNRDRPGH